MAIKTNRDTKILDAIQKAQLRNDLPELHAGDTVSVYVKIVEGNKTRVQRMDGIVLRVHGKGLAKSFTIRKESYGVGVEQSFTYSSPLIVRIEVIKHGKVRRAYLTYMRKRSGKTARIKERAEKKTVTK